MADSFPMSNGISNKESNETYTPCFKHATENLSQKSKPDVSSEGELCKGCSKTMLSYIFLIQNVLDGLTRKLSKNEDPDCCVQCLRQKSQSIDLPCEENVKNTDLKSEILVNSNGIVNGESATASSGPTTPELKVEAKASQNLEQDITPTVTSSTEVTPIPKRPRKVSSRRNSRRFSRDVKENVNEVSSERCASRNGWQTDFLYNVSSSIEPKYVPYNQQQQNSNLTTAFSNKRNGSQEDIHVSRKDFSVIINNNYYSNSSDSSPLTPGSTTSFFDNPPSIEDSGKPLEKSNFNKEKPSYSSELDHPSIADSGKTSEKSNFNKEKPNDSSELDHPSIADSGKPLEKSNFNKEKPNDSSELDHSVTESISNHHKSEADDFPESDYPMIENALNHTQVDDSANSDYESNASHSDPNVDESSKSDCSGTESLDRELDSIIFKPRKNGKIVDQNVENWRTLHDSFGDRVPAEDREFSEAFVTICRNNAEALGCLVLGSSLLLSRTSRKLCVLVFDDVHPLFKEPLSSVFHVVQHVRHLKSIDEKKIEYLKHMNLEKLNIWCLVQFSKCVFLNPDCLILRNCDELFQHEELSAVPDIGWPDCFNSGVFVFAPSVNTLSKMVELSQKQGQNNEGDQMLLNTYFNSWSSDMGKKLSFIYNLIRNTSYTYGPALQRFGPNVKVVQFLGVSKPWEVKFFTQTGQLEDDENVHPKHVRFFSEWINTFKIAVLKLFPQDVYTYAFNQTSVSAEDIGLALCFPIPYEDSDPKSIEPVYILPKRTVKPLYPASPRKTIQCDTPKTTDVCHQISDVHLVEEVDPEFIANNCIEQNGQVEDEAQNVAILNESPFDRCLPGAIVGDYQGMQAWEQGHIDYEGCDRSENIMKRLSFLINRSV